MRHAFVVVLLVGSVPSLRATPTEAVNAAALDLANLHESIQTYQRYLWHPGPRGAAESFDAVIRFQANSLSRKGQLESPLRVRPDLWRVDLRNYKWDAETWEKFAKLDPYFHVKVTRHVYVKANGKVVRNTKGLNVVAPWVPAKPFAAMVELTESEAPIVRADWWLVQVCRQLSLNNKQTGVGYYDWLGIKDRNDFFKLARFKAKDSQALELDKLAAVSKSGVSEQNRQIVRDPTVTGSAWGTLDTNDATGRGNAVRNLRRGDFQHQAEEWYITLSNGLFANYLGDNNGVRQDSAPDFIGPDTSALNAATDGRIHVFLACVRCHAGEVLKPIDDWPRKNYTVGRLALLVPAGFKELGVDKQYELFQDLKRQYLSDLNGALDQDRKAYQRAIIAACGVDAGELSRRFAKAYHGYADTPVGPEQAALELGCTVTELRNALRHVVVGKGGLDPQLLAGLYVVPADPIPRVHWEELFPLAHKIMALDLRD